MAVSALGLPRPDEYDIPNVGNNQRSQYYVLHDDGSYKYGFDTGEDAFESQKTNSDGEVKGRYGYTDSDGQEIRVQYTSGSGGFVAEGDHIPKVHPDVTAAFNAARAAGSFEDPLAGAGGDRSYNFDFEGDEHSRTEVSDSDGTVRGSYSYIDEFGHKKSYNYRAGKGIGFVIEGDDLPQQVQPLPTHTSTTQFGASSQRKKFQTSKRRSGGQKTSVPQSATRITNTKRITTVPRRTVARKQNTKPAQTYFPPTNNLNSQYGAATRSSSNSRQTGHSSHSHSTHSIGSPRPIATRQNTRTVANTRNIEVANTRASQSPSGSYSLAYETSSHSRQESGDDNNNVRGKFSFTSDDDGVDRSINYEASSSTGFIAEGKHLPIGPIVPGAPTGQVTGRIVPVVQIPFVDPLAKEDMDASYSFGFESDDYSRTEVADKDGNVSGTYSILGEDGILRTYKFRAGKGIGFETEEVSARPGRRNSQTSGNTRQQSKHSSFNVGTSNVVSKNGAYSQSTRLSLPSSSGSSSRFSHQGTAPVATTYSQPQAHSSRATAQSSAFSASLRSRNSEDREIFPSFSLRQYDPSEGRGKYGYVLRYDD